MPEEGVQSPLTKEGTVPWMDDQRFLDPNVLNL